MVCAGVNILISIPFFFFPKTLPKEGTEDMADETKNDEGDKHREKAKEEKRGITKGKRGNFKLWFILVCG